MFRKIKIRAINFMILTILLGLFLGNASADPYYAGYEWNRWDGKNSPITEYTTSSNPGPDREGNNVWSYEWFTGMDYLNTNLMTQVTSWGDPQRWEYGGNNISGWDQNPGYANNPDSPLIRWTNPVGDNTEIDIQGNFWLWWGGANQWHTGHDWMATPNDLQFVLGYHDISESQTTLLIDQYIDSPFTGEYNCGPNFGDCPSYTVLLDLQLSMDLGDSIFWTALRLDNVNTGGRWITLNDGNMSISIVPEPVSSTLFIVGSAILGFRRFKKRVS